MPQLMFVLLFALSNKPNPNQINVNNVKPGVVNGTGVQAQNTGAGRACESCYSKWCASEQLFIERVYAVLQTVK